MPADRDTLRQADGGPAELIGSVACVAEVVRQRGSVAELHALDPFADITDSAPVDPQVWWCDPTDAALVLGSRQSPELLDDAAVSAAGLSVVRRRSGGGAVIVRPDAMVWIDVVLPHGLAPDDIRGAMVWIGECWRRAVAPFVGVDGVAPELTVHRGGMVESAWSDLICFAGIGPGEVLLDGRKLVGLSQRRTRHGLRMQGLVHRSPLTAALPGLLVGDLPTDDLAKPAALSALTADTIAAALAAQIS